MRIRRAGLLAALLLFQSPLAAQADSAKPRRYPWVAVGVQGLGRWGEVVIEGAPGSGSPSRTVLLGRVGDRVGYQLIAGIPTRLKDIDIEVYGQATGKRELRDSTGQRLGTVQEVILAVGIDRGVFRGRDAPVNVTVAGRLGVGLLKYDETIPVGLPKTSAAAVLSADVGLSIRFAPFMKGRVTIGVAPATGGPLFYAVTGGLALRLPH